MEDKTNKVHEKLKRLYPFLSYYFIDTEVAQKESWKLAVKKIYEIDVTDKSVKLCQP